MEMSSVRGMELGQCLFWETKKPYEDRTRKSSVFWYKGWEWYLELAISMFSPVSHKETESYELYIRNREGNKGTMVIFRMSVYVMDDDSSKSISLLAKAYDGSERIGSFSVSKLIQSMRSYHSRRTIQFIIIFHGNADLKLDSSRDSQSYRNLTCLEQLSSDFSKLLDDDSDKDVQLICGDQTIKAHRKILSARSRVFQAMLQSDMAEAGTGVIEIQDIEEDVFQQFIRYLYTGKLPEISEDNARHFYEVCDKYEVEKLVKLSINVLIGSLKPENACEILILSDAHADQQLKEGVIKYMIDTKIPLRDEYWIPLSDSHPKLALEVINRAYKSKNYNSKK